MSVTPAACPHPILGIDWETHADILSDDNGLWYPGKCFSCGQRVGQFFQVTDRVELITTDKEPAR